MRIEQEPALRIEPDIEELYYIQNTGYCGNCIKFWRPDGHGYTMNLDDAWLVTKEKALSICRSRPTEDIPWPASVLQAAAQRHVSIEVLNEHLRTTDNAPDHRRS